MAELFTLVVVLSVFVFPLAIAEWWTERDELDKHFRSAVDLLS